jgi:hypothetical protein
MIHCRARASFGWQPFAVITAGRLDDEITRTIPSPLMHCRGVGMISMSEPARTAWTATSITMVTARTSNTAL